MMCLLKIGNLPQSNYFEIINTNRIMMISRATMNTSYIVRLGWQIFS